MNTPDTLETRWQKFMNQLGKVGKDGKPLVVDGDFGANTRCATVAFQSYNNIPQTGVLDAQTLAAAKALGFVAPAAGKYPFVAAKWFTKGPRRCPITTIVIHDMEAPEKATTAENVSRYFADPRDKNGNPVKASAHYNVDCDSVVQCVRDEDIAYHAQGANSNGIGVEHAGYARQSREEWLDEYSTAMLQRSAVLVAELCSKYGIPAVHLTVDELKAGRPGICGHKDVTDAFCGGKGHTDPGKSFPWDIYLGMVAEALDDLVKAAFPPESNV